jgi:hypothetical protein
VTIRLPISSGTWRRLVEANRCGVQRGWAEAGVFGPGIGPQYEPNGPASLLYVGKSAGPLGTAVGSVYDQAATIRASTEWMTGFRNKSAFWQMVDKVDPTRLRISWTNVCKMDQLGGQRPPSGAMWKEIADACMTGLAEEIGSLSPRVVLLATSGAYSADVRRLIADLGYRPQLLDFEDGWTSLFVDPVGKSVIETKHPQGWPNTRRDRVVELVRQILMDKATVPGGREVAAHTAMLT